MTSRTASFTVRLVDDVSKPARGVAQALKEAEAAAKAVAKGMANAGVAGFKALLGGFGLSSSATALHGSAAALTAAATRLGGGAVAGGVGAATGGAVIGGSVAAGAVVAGVPVAGNIAAGNPLDIGLSAEEARAKNNKRRSLETSHNPGGSSREQDDKLKALLRGGGASSPKVDTSALDGFMEKTGQAKDKLGGLNTTVKPGVDTSDIAKADGMVDALIAKIRGLGAEAAAIAGRLSSLGSAQRGNFATGGTKGE